MAVHLRMKMFGRTNRPEFRIVAADQRSPRDGKIIENLGWYHPLEKDAAKVLLMKQDRIKHWLSVGAQPSETLVSIFKKHGIKIPWVEHAKETLVKKVADRRAKKGKAPKVAKTPAPAAAQPKKPETATAKAETPKAEPAKAAPTTAVNRAQVEEKAKAADSKAAKREAKKAKG